MRYEVKIGILAIVAIFGAFWGFKFIQGSNLFDSSNEYFINYENVAGLTVGTPVQISGVNVGSVSSIQLDQQSRLVQVALDIRDEINVPVGTKAYIATVSIMGEKAVELVYDRPCFGDDCAPDGSTLEGATKGMLASFLGTDPDADPADGIKEQVGNAVDSLNWMLFSEDSDNPIARSSRDLAVTMENLKEASRQLQGIMSSNRRAIDATMDNLSSLSSTLEQKEAAIGGIIDNTQDFTSQLTGLELERTVANVNANLEKLGGTLEEADRAMTGITGIMTNVQNGKGTLGKLLNDDAIYDRLDRASLAADTLLTDFQERPYRYVPFKSRKRVLKYDRKDAEN